MVSLSVSVLPPTHFKMCVYTQSQHRKLPTIHALVNHTDMKYLLFGVIMHNFIHAQYVHTSIVHALYMHARLNYGRIVQAHCHCACIVHACFQCARIAHTENTYGLQNSSGAYMSRVYVLDSQTCPVKQYSCFRVS